MGRLLLEFLRDSEAEDLLALMLLNECRRNARVTESGDVILLSDQDRSRWDRAMIAEGVALEQALRSRCFGAYTLQAAIAVVHAETVRPEETDWPQIIGLYDLLGAAIARAEPVGVSRRPPSRVATVRALFWSPVGPRTQQYWRVFEHEECE